MTLSVNEARFGYNHVTSQDAANENMSIVGPGVYLDPLYGSKCAMSFSGANSLVIDTGAVWANGHYVTIKSPKTVSIANGQSGYKRNDIVCIHCHIDDFGHESATASYELVVTPGTQTTGTPDDPVIVNDAISNLVEDSYAPIARVKLEGLVPTVEPLMTMLPALMDLITTGRIENKAVTKSKLADHCVGQQQLETSVWDSISQCCVQTTINNGRTSYKLKFAGRPIRFVVFVFGTLNTVSTICGLINHNGENGNLSTVYEGILYENRISSVNTALVDSKLEITINFATNNYGHVCFLAPYPFEIV